MPTISRIGPYKFYFYGHEPNEPPHVHVDRDNLSAKYWLQTAQLARNIGLSPRELKKLGDLVKDHQNELLEKWYGYFGIDLMDGRTITVPLAWYPTLQHATAGQLANWEPCGGGYGIHWPEIDEHLNTEGLLRGVPAPRAQFVQGAKTES